MPGATRASTHAKLVDYFEEQAQAAEEAGAPAWHIAWIRAQPDAVTETLFPGRIRYPELQDEAWLREQYVTRERSLTSIAAELGCTTSQVSKQLTKRGIPSRDLPGPKRVPHLDDATWLREQYETQSVAQIAAGLGCNATSVLQALVRHGIPRRPRNGWPVQFWQLKDEAWLRAEYVERRRTRGDVAAEIGCSPHTLSNALGRLGLTRTPRR